MAASAYVRARIDPTLKEEAALVLDSLGLTISDVMRMTLTRIAREKALPLELALPNPETLAAMEEARALKSSRSPRFDTADKLFDTLTSGKSAGSRRKDAA